MLAVASNQYVWTQQMRQQTVAQLAGTTQPSDWVKLSAGDGSKGPRTYEWVRIPLLSWQMPGERWLLVRRSLADGKLAYYVCYAPRGAVLTTLVRIAGMRWTVEECFEAAKGEVGLDQYEVRSWHGWYRHITLAMMALAYLAILCRHEADAPRLKKKPMPGAMAQWKGRRQRASWR